MKELIELQKHLTVKKDQSPKNNMYKYRKVDDILRAVRESGIENIYIVLSDELVELAGNVYTKGTATIYNGEMSVSASSYAKEGNLPGQSDPQISGSCSTYARKKALEGLLALDDGNDPDGNPLPDKKPQQQIQYMTGKQKGTLKDQLLELEKLGSESANKAMTAVETCLSMDKVAFDEAAHLINRVKLTLEKERG